MEVLDTTIANVALRHIAGGLSAAVTDGEWVITSYLAANAIILPISGWLSIRLGRRNYFLLSILIFTVASALCGMATSLNMLIFSRVLQGLAGGGLQPSSQGVLLDAFPKEKQGAAQTVFGIAALLAPVVGPTLGGYITDNYGWRWVFYLNVPVGLLALVMCNALVFDPALSESAKRRGAQTSIAPFDTLGLCLLARHDDFLGNLAQQRPGMGLVRRSVSARANAGAALRAWPGRSDCARDALRQSADQFPDAEGPKLSRLLHHHLLRVCHRSTRTPISLPALLQSLFGYDATTSGLVLSPAGIFAIIMLAIVGRLLGRGVDARYLMARVFLSSGSAVTGCRD